MWSPVEPVLFFLLFFFLDRRFIQTPYLGSGKSMPELCWDCSADFGGGIEPGRHLVRGRRSVSSIDAPGCPDPGTWDCRTAFNTFV